MKKSTSFLLAVSVLAGVSLKAQTEAPAGFSKGSIVLTDGKVIAGYIKEDMQKKASLTIIPDGGSKKKSYDAYNLSAAALNDSRFLCIQGDFFKVLCQGDLSFLQKMSNAGGKMVYNGADPLYLTGTEGKTGDYFVHNTKLNNLQLVTEKTLDAVVKNSFADCAAAISKAKETGTDIARLKEAVDIYNNRNTK